ncbi:Uma2 family endonuclease, partial [Microcoleus sp. LAD1_D5]
SECNLSHLAPVSHKIGTLFPPCCTSSSIDRLSLYASLGVPEVWRYDGNRLIIYQLETQEYVERDVSPTFPFLSQVEMLRFLELRRTTKENALIRLFREWVRSQI